MLRNYCLIFADSEYLPRFTGARAGGFFFFFLFFFCQSYKCSLLVFPVVRQKPQWRDHPPGVTRVSITDPAADLSPQQKHQSYRRVGGRTRCRISSARLPRRTAESSTAVSHSSRLRTG